MLIAEPTLNMTDLAIQYNVATILDAQEREAIVYRSDIEMDHQGRPLISAESMVRRRADAQPLYRSV